MGIEDINLSPPTITDLLNSERYIEHRDAVDGNKVSIYNATKDVEWTTGEELLEKYQDSLRPNLDIDDVDIDSLTILSVLELQRIDSEGYPLDTDHTQVVSEFAALLSRSVRHRSRNKGDYLIVKMLESKRRIDRTAMGWILDEALASQEVSLTEYASFKQVSVSASL